MEIPEGLQAGGGTTFLQENLPSSLPDEYKTSRKKMSFGLKFSFNWEVTKTLADVVY